MCTEKYVKEMFTNGLNMALPLQALVKETIHRVETHQLCRKEKIPGTAVSKEDYADNL